MDTTETKKRSGGKKMIPEGAKRGDSYAIDPRRLTVIGVDTQGDDAHPLYHVDNERHLKPDPAMVASIKMDGVIQGIKVVQVEGRLLVAVGRRRVLNARVANEELAKEGRPAVLVPYTLVKMADGIAAMASENEIRRATSLMEKANLADKMRLAGGMEVEDIAVRFGVQPNTIRTWFSYLKASPKVHAAVASGKISESAGARLGTLPEDKQTEALDKALADAKEGKPASYHAVRKAANEAKGKEGNVGIKSRKALKALRSEASGEGDEGKEGQAYLAGIRDAISLFLGDQRPEDTYKVGLAKLVRKAQRAKGDE